MGFAFYLRDTRTEFSLILKFRTNCQNFMILILSILDFEINIQNLNAFGLLVTEILIFRLILICKIENLFIFFIYLYLS